LPRLASFIASIVAALGTSGANGSAFSCATLVSPDGGGAPVILDDALGWSDPARLKDMGAVINKAGDDCQIIILTCTPGRYAHVGNATVVRLPTS